ncbi:MAG: J domain-containing protein, partial [Planctomycetes bacterium]|nr:J domain-containing protein [Planctomycetota bacterium]
GPGPRAAGARRPRPRRGGDVQHRLTVSFLTAARGGTERIRLGGGSGGGAGGGQSIEVKIPAGIDSGAKLRLKGKGHPGPDGGAAGDIILTIAVGKHPYFRREGLDLLVDVPLTLAEAALGTTVTVPLLTGSVEIKVPPGAASGQRLRVKGKGIARPQGAAGDFHAVIQIAAPKTLSDRARQLLSDLAPELKNPRESAPWAADARGSAG